MDKKSETDVESAKKSKANGSLWFGIIFAAMIVLMIAGMAAIDIYGENLAGAAQRGPADAADR
jgi:flagellar basal body-associated protein FliL